MPLSETLVRARESLATFNRVGGASVSIPISDPSKQGCAGAGCATQRPLRLQEFAVPQRAVLGRAPLRLVVDMHDAEALHVARGPLEVVEQAPDHVAGHRHALAQRLANGGNVRRDVFGTVAVVDAPAIENVLE